MIGDTLNMVYGQHFQQFVWRWEAAN